MLAVKTSVGHARPPMIINSIRRPSMALGWSHGSIASWPPMGVSGAIGGHRAHAWLTIVFIVWYCTCLNIIYINRLHTPFKVLTFIKYVFYQNISYIISKYRFLVFQRFFLIFFKFIKFGEFFIFEIFH